ncbi:MAG: GntR family transcriptional regulator [Terriglobia bacterium]
MVKRIYRKTLRNHLGEHLLDAIINREIRPGDRIVEGKLARDLGVAKTTLREALNDLEHRGLIIKSSNGSTYVTKLTVNDVDNIYNVRLLLEPEAAALAHQRLTPRDYAHLAHLLDKMKAAGERKDYLDASKNDMVFHQVIWELSGNMVLARALNAVSVPLFAFSGLHLMRLFSTRDSDFAGICDGHQTLLTKLKEGSADEVRKIFVEKLQQFKAQNFEGAQLLEADPHQHKSNQEDVHNNIHRENVVIRL